MERGALLRHANLDPLASAGLSLTACDTPAHSSIMARIRLGTQGWNYDAWVGPFFPTGHSSRGLPHRVRSRVRHGGGGLHLLRSRGEDGARLVRPHAGGLHLCTQAPGDHARAAAARRGRHRAPVLRPRASSARSSAPFIQLGPDFGPVELPAFMLPKLPATSASPSSSGSAPGSTTVCWRCSPSTTSRSRCPTRAGSRASRCSSLATRPTTDFVYVRWMGPDRDIIDYSRIQVDRTPELEAWAGVLWPLAELEGQVYGYVNNHFAGQFPRARASCRDCSAVLGRSIDTRRADVIVGASCEQWVVGYCKRHHHALPITHQ